ncbi:unnamed protein product [Lota lota]
MKLRASVSMQRRPADADRRQTESQSHSERSTSCLPPLSAHNRPGTTVDTSGQIDTWISPLPRGSSVPRTRQPAGADPRTVRSSGMREGRRKEHGHLTEEHWRWLHYSAWRSSSTDSSPSACPVISSCLEARMPPPTSLAQSHVTVPPTQALAPSPSPAVLKLFTGITERWYSRFFGDSRHHASAVSCQSPLMETMSQAERPSGRFPCGPLEKPIEETL